MDQLLIFFIPLVFLLALSAFFSGSEAALYSLTRPQVRSLEQRSPAGRAVGALLKTPRKLLVTILIGNLIVNIFTTSAATALLMDTFGERGVGYAFLIMSVLIIIFGEILPKVIALRWSERVAVLSIIPLRIFHTAVTPLRAPLSLFSDAVISRLRKSLGRAKTHLAWDELITAVQIGRTSGAVELFEFEVLSNILAFREKIVKEIMTPSIDVVSQPVNAGRAELLNAFLSSGFSRIPIYGETHDDVIGILHIKDLIDPGAAANEPSVRELLREPFFIPETAPINELYKELQARNAHIAAVIDEYASYVGIATIEDILEELVGDIRDARDPKVEPYMRIDDDRIVVPGTMEIDDFNAAFGTAIQDQEHETIAGYVTGFTGKIPREGEVFEEAGLRFYIISAQPNRIRKLRVERL